MINGIFLTRPEIISKEALPDPMIKAARRMVTGILH
jgi:hypothetical protein